jgi:hypothetical protein
MKFFKLTAIGCLLMFFLGLLAGSVCAFDDPPVPPAVSVDVDASAQLAIEEEAPVLPDDFARNDPPRISAQWSDEIPPEIVKEDLPAMATLFTADGTWRCQPCINQQSFLASNPPAIKFKTVKIPAEGQSPTGKAPVWLAPDGTIFEGAMDTKTLEKWIKEHSPEPVSSEAIRENSLSVVKVDSASVSTVVFALIAHAKRYELKAAKSDPGPLITWLPEIDVDLSDPFLKMLDGLMSRDGMRLGGGRIAWPAGKRVVSFSPPIDVSYRKILEISVSVKAIEVSENGREVVVRMNGRLIPDLKVILK